MTTTRRQFLSRSAIAGTGFLFFRGAPVLASETGSGFFSSEERSTLTHLSNSIFPGSADLGSIDYIEQLCDAMEPTADQSPPRIFAGGPNSDRNGQTANDFKNFLPLTRVQERAWKLYLYGSDGVPEGGPNDGVLPKIVGLRELLKWGVADARVFGLHLNSEFHDTLVQLVLESVFAAPEYGGNRDGGGWRLIHFDGDSQPRGFSRWNELTESNEEFPETPVSTANPGEDPDSLNWLTEIGLRLIVTAESGRVFY